TEVKSGGTEYELPLNTTPVSVVVTDTITPVDVTITAIVSTPKIIDVTTATDGTTGVKVTGYNSDGKKVDLSIISGTDHDGFGVDGNNLSNGDTKELGVGEKIVVEFTNGKDVNSLDVSFAWRNNHETAKLTFVKDGQVVGYATVDGDGSSTTKAIVKYYDENNNLIKTQEAEGSSDRVDKAFTFELPDSNGGIVSFDKVEFSAPQNKDDYLINKIVYKEVLNPEVTDIVTNGGNITFNIQVDENYPPQGAATATVEVNGKEYSVELNSTGRGTLTIDSKELGNLSNIIAKVVKVEGGNYEKVNPTEASFNFTPTLKSTDDSIITEEDAAYILKVTDFGNVSVNTKEFKITELPTNGKLYLIVTKGETIIDKDGNKTIATEDTKVGISKNQIVTLADVGAGRVVFEPTANSDADGQFKFQVGDGKGHFSSEYTTTIDVKAVADTPEVTISITQSTNNPSSDGSDNNQNGGNNSSDWWGGYSSKEDIIDTSRNYTKTGDYNSWKNYTNNSDSIEINGNQSQWISTEDGNDNVYISGNNNGGMNTGTGDDRVFIQGNSTQQINLDDGNDELHIKGNSSTINAGAGDDKILIEGEATNNINLGSGNDELHIKGNSSTISAGDGNDKIRIDGNANGTIELGSGNNYLEIKGDAYSIQVSQNSGNDRVIVSGNATNNISLGAGDDYLELDGKIQNYVDGGEGNNDSVYLKGYTLSEYQALIANGNEWRVQNFENIKLGDGTIVKGDGSVFDDTTTVYKYDISLSAALTDTDGSETLNVIIKNVPASATLESSKYEVSKNSDGSYTVKVPQGETSISDKLTMKVPQEDAKNINLQIEAKATEAKDNEDGQNFKTATDSTTDKTPTLVVGSNKDSVINGGAGKDILIGDIGGTELNVQPGKNYNIALVVDTSGSMKEASGSKTAWGTTISRIDLLKDALKNLADSLKGHDGKINVSIIDFDTNAKEPITFNDLTSKNISDLITKIDALKAEGGTNYEDAFLKTTSWFDTQSVTYGKAQGYENLTYFLTDGDPTFSNRNTTSTGTTTEYSDMKDAVDAFKTLSGQSTVHAIGIGNGINENYLRFFDNTDIIGQGDVSFGYWFWKQTVSGNIGKPDIVNTAEDLKAALEGGSVSEDILDVGSDTINGGDGDDIIFGDSINTDNLLWNGRFVEGHENYMSKGQGINALDKYLSLSKSGYEDMTTLEKNMAKFDYIKEHHSDLNVEGDTRGGDDIISGGAGRDIIYGQGGDDTIITDLNTNNGKEDGDIIIDGGTGYDTLILEGDNNIDFSLLKDASITNIEAIDLTQGNHKLQNLTLDDVLKLSGDDNTIKITGDEFDSVTFKNTVGDDGKENAWSKTEGTGADKGYDIYMNSGDPTVQVKVEQPISDGITN
ncbi:vWA domain-containing protein, partial [Aliarcobacter butzleri]|uniref:vWA domain-containing protein n=1 Tax=Aliarcobacter butzleri TaxID=28197 RepID=UPI0021B3F050